MIQNFKSGSPHLIFAYGASDPKPDLDISYHGSENRGTQQVLLISGAVNKEQDVEGIETMEFLLENVSSCSKLFTLCVLTDSFEYRVFRHIFRLLTLLITAN